MDLNLAFAKRVKELLKIKNIKQYQLEQLTGIYHSTMTDILTCKYKTTNFKNMALIIKELGLSFSEFFDSKLYNFENLNIE